MGSEAWLPLMERHGFPLFCDKSAETAHLRGEVTCQGKATDWRASEERNDRLGDRKMQREVLKSYVTRNLNYNKRYNVITNVSSNVR